MTTSMHNEALEMAAIVFVILASSPFRFISQVHQPAFCPSATGIVRTVATVIRQSS